MTYEPVVAVVVPTYRRPAALRRCLEAIRAGSRRPDELWVCDQSPDDATRAVAEELPGVRYLHLPHPNASAAREAGLRAAGSELVAFTDDDCIPDAGWLAGLVTAYLDAAAGALPVAAVSGGILPLPGGNGVAVSSRTGTVRQVFHAGDGSLDRAAWAPWDAGSGGNLLVDRALARAAGGWDPQLGPGTRARAGEDVDLLYRLARHGDLVFTPAARVHHAPGTRADRLSRRYPYGRGMGAALGKQLAAGDPAALRLLGLYARHQAAAALRSPWGPVESALTLAGLAAGLARRRRPAADPVR